MNPTLHEEIRATFPITMTTRFGRRRVVATVSVPIEALGDVYVQLGDDPAWEKIDVSDELLAQAARLAPQLRSKAFEPQNGTR